MDNLVFVQAALGYRSWRVYNNGNLDNLQLRALSSDDAWQPGSNKAECNRGRPHSAPDSDCTCGYYSHHSYQQAQNYYAPGRMIGAVAGSGEIEVHHTGYRASRVQILALLKPENETLREPLAEMVAARYQVPLFDSVEELEEYLDMLPVAAVPASVRPARPQKIRYWDGFADSPGVRLATCLLWGIAAVVLLQLAMVIGSSPLSGSQLTYQYSQATVMDMSALVLATAALMGLIIEVCGYRLRRRKRNAKK